jgi:predicted XRE-type DNA-binding protein
MAMDSAVAESSGNVFADLGLADAEDLQLQAELSRQIYHRLKNLGLTPARAAKRLGLKQSEVSNLLKGRHSGFGAERLMVSLNELAVDVEIVLRPKRQTPTERGTIRVREAV